MARPNARQRRYEKALRMLQDGRKAELASAKALNPTMQAEGGHVRSSTGSAKQRKAALSKSSGMRELNWETSGSVGKVVKTRSGSGKIVPKRPAAPKPKDPIGRVETVVGELRVLQHDSLRAEARLSAARQREALEKKTWTNGVRDE